MEGNCRLLIFVAAICQEKCIFAGRTTQTAQTVWRGAHVGAENLSGRDDEWQHDMSEDGADG